MAPAKAEVADPATKAAIDQISAGIAALRSAGLSPTGCRDAATMMGQIEQLSRRLHACQIDVLADTDARDLQTEDLAMSAKIMMRHRAKLSSGEATARNNVMRCLRDLPEMQRTYRRGLIAEPNMRRIANAWCNERIRAKLIESESQILERALTLNHPHFCQFMTGWVRLADEDGARRDDETTHDKRKASMVENFDRGFTFEGQCGSLQGAMMREIWSRFTQAEFELDWAAAIEKHGEGNVTAAMLERTDAQRRMDALAAIFDQAASMPPGSIGPQFVLNVVMDHTTYERQLTRLAGGLVLPDDPNRADYQCRTLDGTPLNPAEVAAASLLGHVRRIVVDSAGVVINMGRKSRLFSGPAAIAAKIGSDTCYWPGCWVRASQCQVDHLHQFNPTDGSEGGGTDQKNAGPLCAKHNRLKQAKGFSTYRDDGGRWRVLRPDGTEIDP